MRKSSMRLQASETNAHKPATGGINQRLLFAQPPSALLDEFMASALWPEKAPAGTSSKFFFSTRTVWLDVLLATRTNTMQKNAFRGRVDLVISSPANLGKRDPRCNLHSVDSQFIIVVLGESVPLDDESVSLVVLQPATREGQCHQGDTASCFIFP